MSRVNNNEGSGARSTRQDDWTGPHRLWTTRTCTQTPVDRRVDQALPESVLPSTDTVHQRSTNRDRTRVTPLSPGSLSNLCVSTN